MLKLRCSFGIIRLEFHWSASGKVSKRAEMAFLKVNGKSEIITVEDIGLSMLLSFGGNHRCYMNKKHKGAEISRVWLTIVIVLSIYLNCAYADLVKLKSGERIEGIVGKESDGKLSIELKSGKTVFDNNDIEEILKSTRYYNNSLKILWAKEKRAAKTKGKPKTIVSVRRKRGTIRIVKCNDGVHSYAVCLPSDYKKREKCPVIFCFDPGGRGKLAVGKFAFSAEKYGCIIVGSLDAKNGPWKRISKAQSAMLEDIPKRYKTDEKTYYAAGFSGGASMSYTIAYNNPSKFKGVIACGGGFGLGKISKDIAVYHCAGNKDSAGMSVVKKNHSELQRKGVKSELNVFSGGHNWPPDIVIKQALDWLMKR
jgi:hypothetical protein